MSKHFTSPARKVPLKPSRIRRQPVQLVPDVPKAAVRKPVRLSDREQMWFGVTGVLIMAAALVVLIVAAAIFTFTRDDPAAEAPAFPQCYASGGSNCVLDGDTIYFGGQRVEMAGIAAPAIQGAQCDAERDKGIAAAMGLAALLNRGQVTVSPPSRDFYGRIAQTVEVNGVDVGQTLSDQGLVRTYDGTKPNWCASAG